ncbi:MAG: site-specific DNA-methyltransferase [Candidatus Brocadiaceae bacterium]|nr:site-specific DNA-methyltransferase [Candidatus Brocadiaceae bacterium]
MSKELLPAVKEQLSLEYAVYQPKKDGDYVNNLIDILSNDLDFHRKNSSYASHNFHSFPAKFPPQLPLQFIKDLTEPNDVVLDPMMGSGTTVLEAYLTGRRGIGFDIDPLAIMISKVKTTPLKQEELIRHYQEILKNAKNLVNQETKKLEQILLNRWDSKTKQFIDYWFAQEIQLELLALVLQISRIEDVDIRTFFELAFSAIIITKSGGVSLALDLAHTRPHKAKVVFSTNGRILFGEELDESEFPRLKILTKKLRSPIEEFEKRCIQNIEGLVNRNSRSIRPEINFGNAQKLPLEDKSVDLIVTSPPYASNAIDYMRAHKFPLVWFGYQIDELSLKRKEYIGGEVMTNIDYEKLPDFTSTVVADISRLDSKRGKVLHRYYSEMTRTLREMYRVLKYGKAAIVVVGNSVMRGKDTETQNCLVDIGRNIGFEVPKIGVRKLDRNKRMLPAGIETNTNSQIQQRMHEEYVIGFYKPEN